MNIRRCMTFPVCLLAVSAGTTQLRAQAVPTGSTLLFAHFANGNTGNGVWTTDFSFVSNSSSPATGTLSLFGDSGAPFSLATNQGTASSFNITLAPGGQFDIVTTGAGNVVGGYAVATFNHAVIGSTTFALSTSSGGEVVSVGVLSTHPHKNFVSPATFGIGIAIVNASGGNTNNVLLEASDAGGTVVGTANLTLAPLQHKANNLNLLITSLPSTFVGSIRLSGDHRFIALAIGVQPDSDSAGFASWSLPALSYDPVPSSASGTFTITKGPDTGASGTLSMTGFEAPEEDFLTGTVSITVNGTTVSGPFLANIDPFGLLVTFSFTFPGFPIAGFAVAPQGTGNTLSGTVVNFGNGDSGTFTLTVM